MGEFFASIASACGKSYEWLQSLGPAGLAVEFLGIVILVFACLWLTCRTCSSVFWKRTDYAYFLFAILGGAAGAADLAVSNWAKQLDGVQMNIISNTVLLSGLVSSASSACDKVEEKADEQKRFGGDVLRPNEPIDHMDRFLSLDLSLDDCRMVKRISTDMQSDTLQTTADYGLRVPTTNSIFFDFAFRKEIMSRIAITLAATADGRERKEAIKQQLAQLSYLSIFKSLSPILLGLGIGIRLARTHYDVRAEERKASAETNATA